MEAGLGYTENERSDKRQQRDQQPQPPPRRARLAADELVTAETAVTIEGPGNAAAVPALVKLQGAMRAAGLLLVIEHHRGLVTARTQAGRDKR
jgi:hypothetical protein